jgi:hypothetical protein
MLCSANDLSYHVFDLHRAHIVGKGPSLLPGILVWIVQEARKNAWIGEGGNKVKDGAAKKEPSLNDGNRRREP